MNNFITPEQIRINAVLGVCQRQRELVAENRKLQKRLQAKKMDDIAGMIGLTIATFFVLACIVF
jgi:hypothetical protein